MFMKSCQLPIGMPSRDAGWGPAREVAAGASGAVPAGAACCGAACCGSIPCDSPPKAFPVSPLSCWYFWPSFWKSKFGSVKKCNAVSAPCDAKLTPVDPPCWANGIQPPRAWAPPAVATVAGGAAASADAAEATEAATSILQGPRAA